MAELKGNITKDSNIILSDLNIIINEYQRDNGLKVWDGYFETEKSLGVNLDGYEIELSDGRKGKIHIENITHERTYMVQFSGNGPLK